MEGWNSSCHETASLLTRLTNPPSTLPELLAAISSSRLWSTALASSAFPALAATGGSLEPERVRRSTGLPATVLSPASSARQIYSDQTSWQTPSQTHPE